MSDSLSKISQDFSSSSQSLVSQTRDLQQESFAFQSTIQNASYSLQVKTEVLSQFSPLYRSIVALGVQSVEIVELVIRLQLLFGISPETPVVDSMGSKKKPILFSPELREFALEVKQISLTHAGSLDQANQLVFQLSCVANDSLLAEPIQEQLSNLCQELNRLLVTNQSVSVALAKLSDDVLFRNVAGSEFSKENV